MAAPRKENIKDIVLNATTALLENHSFAEISLAEIAKAAGISKGTLYYHYKTKSEIFFDLADRYLCTQWDDFIRWTENKECYRAQHRFRGASASPLLRSANRRRSAAGKACQALR